MRESIADALRAHADRDLPLATTPGLAAFEGLQDLLASIHRGIASESVPVESKERKREEVGSEEFAVLARRFGMDYGREREEGGEEGEERVEVRGEVRERGRDEL